MLSQICKQHISIYYLITTSCFVFQVNNQSDMNKTCKNVLGPDMSEMKDLRGLTVIIPDRLYLATYSTRRHHPDTTGMHFFSTDYNNYCCRDGGLATYEPLNLGYLVQYIRILNEKMYNHRYVSKAIVHYTVDNSREYNDAAFLIGAYAIVVKQMDPLTIHSILKNNNYCAYKVDSIFGYGKNDGIDLRDCLNVVYKAMKYRMVNFNDFNFQEYDNRCRDMTWIVPDKLVAFRGPIECDNAVARPGRNVLLRNFVKYFKENNVKTVIRLNDTEYNNFWFSTAGIEYVDLCFKDGSAPTVAILKTFLRISEQTPDAVAVHCRAGLGRTGTLIAAYLIQHYRMTACEAIAWVRLCRPGSITVKSQQLFLAYNESMLWKKGDAHRKEKYGSASKLTYCTRGIYSANCQKKSTSLTYNSVPLQ